MIIFKNSFDGYTFNTVFDISIKSIKMVMNHYREFKTAQATGKKWGWIFRIFFNSHYIDSFNSSPYHYTDKVEWYL